MHETHIAARPLNVLTARGSVAERVCRARAGLPGKAAAAIPEAIAPGL